uniref:Centromere protein K n=1 Tax=Otus sunia TaxID=257818 RepID=A0A8C8AB85_9STRI
PQSMTLHNTEYFTGQFGSRALALLPPSFLYTCSWAGHGELETFNELQNKMLQLKVYKEELLNALGEFLAEHFPLPENGGSAKKKGSSEEPSVELITLHEILEMLINKLMSTPHEPYVKINDSFWPPYIELLLRYGIALRHPEDTKRMRLEAFHM